MRATTRVTPRPRSPSTAGSRCSLTSRIRNRVAQVAIWAVAIAIPIFVALARMYRGMHHPLDIAGGVLVGVAVVAAMVLVCRAAGHAAAAREAR